MANICQLFLKATRAVALRDGQPTDKGAAVLGDNSFGYTVELADGTQIEVGRQHCKYCARAEAINKLAS